MTEQQSNHPTRSKILKLEELAAAVAEAKAKGGVVVQCHGSFDPLHIGHIRHFEQAKKAGDVLIVTVTPDEFVNKGPHRPVFSAELRAEMIAALDCVNYVAINRWPTAVETIKLLKPSFYAKGEEYRDAADDRTGGIVDEEAAIRGVGGDIAFTDDLTFSASSIVNQHMAVFSEAVSAHLSAFSQAHTSDEVIGYLDGARKLKVLVVGDTILDEYSYVKAIGKSSKEPMLALKHLSTEKFAGGILAVANHVSNFADEVGVATLLGAEHPQEAFIRESLKSNITPFLEQRHNAPTIVKRRFIEEYFFTKLVEVYEMNDEPLAVEDDAAFCAVLEREVPQYDVVLVVDFGHGTISDSAIKVLTERSKFLAVNAQANASNWGFHTVSKYPRADFVCIAENEIRLEARDRIGDLEPMMREISERMGARYVAVTRGQIGCVCYSPEAGFLATPSFAGQVLDRMGAGDSFISITSLCLAQGAPLDLVGFIGNAVGAQAVATIGHRSSIEPVQLGQYIRSLMR